MDQFIVIAITLPTFGLLLLRILKACFETRFNTMNAALTALQEQVAKIDERDDLIVALVGELKTSVDELTALLASRPTDADLQALADTLASTVGKFDGILGGSNPEEPPVTPAEPTAGPS